MPVRLTLYLNANPIEGIERDEEQSTYLWIQSKLEVSGLIQLWHLRINYVNVLKHFGSADKANKPNNEIRKTDEVSFLVNSL